MHYWYTLWRFPYFNFYDTIWHVIWKFPASISDASLIRLIHRLRDISKRADLQISETLPRRLIKDVSSETSQRSLRFSQRRLWVASEIVILGLKTKAFFGYQFIYLSVFTFFDKQNWYRKLLRASFMPEICLQYLYKRITLLDQIGRLHFPWIFLTRLFQRFYLPHIYTLLGFRRSTRKTNIPSYHDNSMERFHLKDTTKSSIKTIDISSLLNTNFGSLNDSSLILWDDRISMCNTTYLFLKFTCPIVKNLEHIFW